MARKCPQCNRLWKETDQFCGFCGISLDEKRPPRPTRGYQGSDAAPGVGMTVLIWVLDLLPGLVSAKVIIASIIGLLVSAVCLGVTILLLGLGAWITMFITGGAAVMVYWTALSWLLYGHVCSPVEALAEFQGKHWTFLILMTCTPIGIFLFIMGAVSTSMQAGGG